MSPQGKKNAFGERNNKTDFFLFLSESLYVKKPNWPKKSFPTLFSL